MSKRLFPLLLLASALWQLSMANPVDPTITPAAVLPRQEVDNDFIGWFLKTSGSTSSWVASSCQSGETWQQSGQNAQCCPKTFQRCFVRTACIEDSGLAYLAFTDSASSTSWWSACTDAYSNPAYSVCNTAFVYESYDKLKEPQTNMICGPSNVNEVYYRTIPASLTEQASTSSTSSLPGTSISSSPGTSSTTSVAPVQTPASESDSKAWIAGAVAGPVLGLALIGAGVWLFLRRKKKAAQSTQHGVAATSHIDLSQPPAGVGGYTDAKPQYQPAQHAYPSPAQNQAYPQQGGFSPPQVSPAPQYGFSPPNNTTASPSMGSYAHDAKYEFNRGAEAAELGGSSTIVPESTNQRP